MTYTAAPPPLARTWTRARLTGNVLLVVWLAVGIALAYFLVAQQVTIVFGQGTGFQIFGINIDLDTAFYSTYFPKFIDGFLVTVQIVALSLVIGAAISLPITFGRMSKNPLATVPSYTFVYFFRGTPLIAQVFLVYYGAGSFVDELKAIGLWWFFRDAFNCVVLTFALNTAAYQAEILRGSIQNIPIGQSEAGQSLGLSKWVIYRKIILPQAMIIALRPYGNEIVLMIKGSAIASIVTVFDLMGETRRAFSRTFDFQTYIWAAIIYLVMVEILRRVWDVLEARLTRHLKRDTDATATDAVRRQREPGEPPVSNIEMPH